MSLSENEFLELIEKHRHEFYRYIHRNVWNASAADDVFSEAVMVAWAQREKFRRGSNFRAWLYKILTNKLYVANRHIMRSSISSDDAPEESYVGEPGALNRATTDREWFLDNCSDEVYEAFQALSDAQRQCLMLRAVERFSYNEIAEIMQIPSGTVMTHLSRGRAKFRKVLAELREAAEARRLETVGADTDSRPDTLGNAFLFAV